MILAIHIGNSNLTIGGVEAGELRFVGRLTTESRTEDEFAAALQGLLQLYGVEQKPAGAIIASVVPPLTQPVCAAAARLTGRRPLVVGPGVKTGLNIAIENPNQLGSDLVVAAAAAAARYPLPLVVVALGTATTFSVVDAHRSFRGGIIAPGVRVGHDALIERASMLTPAELTAPKAVIGANTADSLRSGCVLGAAAMIDGLLLRIEDELGESVTAVATGSLAGLVTPHCRHAITADEHLGLKGLALLYDKNTRK